MKVTYPKDVAGLTKATDTLLVFAPQKSLKSFPKILPDDLLSLVRKMGKDAKPGDQGALLQTLPGSSSPKRLMLAVLPDELSRYNCPARSEAIGRLTRQAGLAGDARHGCLFILDDAGHALPAVNAALRAFPLFSLKSSNGKPGSLQVLCTDKKGKVCRLDAHTRAVCEGSREAARLVDTPPSDMNPEAMAKEVRKLLRGVKNVRTKEIAGPDLLKQKLGGIHAVGRTALKAPRLLIATYTPTSKKRGQKHIALVGKGITFDTGGLSLKGTAGMCGMKGDMGGAAATFGAFYALAKAGCNHKVSLLLCLAENAIGPSAYKNDDVLTLHSGKTVEINNTDAEGRLVLGDGVSYAARVLKADTILDAATLTGAQLVSTGNAHAAIFSNDAGLEQQVQAAGYASGDLVHPLMFAPELYKREFSSRIADMKNSVRNRANAQCSCAAQFIYWHIEDTDAAWCHVDLAGPAFDSDRGTGYGPALLATAVRAL